MAVKRILLSILAAVMLVLLGRQDASSGDMSSLEVKRGRRGSKLIAITFDGGGNIGATCFILDILEEKGVTCTIFLTGRFIRNNPALVLEMVRDGHEIGNHTYSHPHLTTWSTNRRHDTHPGVTREFLHLQLQQTEREFNRLTGSELAKLWRAPYGERNGQILRWARELGYLHILWTSDRAGNLDCLDWVSDPSSRLYLSSLEIKKKILSFPNLDGAVILMHLGSERPHDPVYKKLPEIIDELRGRGYEFVPVSRLLENS